MTKKSRELNALESQWHPGKHYLFERTPLNTKMLGSLTLNMEIIMMVKHNNFIKKPQYRSLRN